MKKRVFAKTAFYKMDLFSLSLLITVSLLFILADANAQVTPEVDVLQQQQMENASQASGEDADLSELEEQRQYLAIHPLDINNSSYEELVGSGLLNDLQAQALLFHIHANGKLITAEEL